MSNKKTFFLVFIIVLLGMVGLFQVNRYWYQKEEEWILKNDNYIMKEILKIAPELEEELKDIVLNAKTIEDFPFDSDEFSQEALSLFGKDDSLKEKMILSNIVLLLGILFLLGMVFLYRKKQYDQKLLEIEHYMEEILNDHYTIDIRDYDEGSLSHLKNYVYKVTVKLKEAKELSCQDKKYLQEMLQDISHQIKTPLTSMYVMNELLEKELPEEKRKELLAKNKSQLQRMEYLVTSLLKISRLDSKTETLQKEKCSVRTLVEKSLEPLEMQMEAKGLNVVMDIPEEMEIFVDFNWMKEALMNIIKNAYEHTEKGSITITASQNPIYREIIISDTGCGIAKEDIPHIFERFYRSRNNNKESIGIGLNMTKKIVELHDGEIKVESSKEGSSFILRFYEM